MEQKTLNMNSANYPIVLEIGKLAEKENRSFANMADTLLKEAISHRKDSRRVTDDHI